MKKKFAHLISGLFLSLPLFANVAGADEIKSEGRVHIVVKGDTLWDISEHYLGNPFLWPKLWQWNDYITNPHFIYPGDEIRLYPPKVIVRRPVIEKPPVVAKEEEEAEIAPAEIAPEEVIEEAPELVEEEMVGYKFSELKSSGMIAEEEMEGVGRIIDADDGRLMLSEGDRIYIAFSETPAIGIPYSVFKTEGKISHPVTGKFLGYKISVLGTVEVKEFADEVATAVITKSYNVISRGDLIKPKEEIPDSIEPAFADSALEGYIVASKESMVTYGEKDIVYIDLGKKNGVKPGTGFIVYKKGERIKDPATGKKYMLPPTTIGKLMAIDIKEETSVAIITNSIEEMRDGERIKAVVR